MMALQCLLIAIRSIYRIIEYAAGSVQPDLHARWVRS